MLTAQVRVVLEVAGEHLGVLAPEHSFLEAEYRAEVLYPAA
jgi:hypothetical protein